MMELAMNTITAESRIGSQSAARETMRDLLNSKDECGNIGREATAEPSRGQALSAKAVQGKTVARYVSRPPMTVSSTFDFRMRSGGAERISSERTTKSANFPAARVPFLLSSKLA